MSSFEFCFIYLNVSFAGWGGAAQGEGSQVKASPQATRSSQVTWAAGG